MPPPITPTRPRLNDKKKMIIKTSDDDNMLCKQTNDNYRNVEYEVSEFDFRGEGVRRKCSAEEMSSETLSGGEKFSEKMSTRRFCPFIKLFLKVECHSKIYSSFINLYHINEHRIYDNQI